MSSNLQNSIWPNADGILGENKVAIPDGVTIKWPDGDALVGNFVYQNGKLVGFVDTKALTVNDSGSTTINYDYTNIELPFAEDAMTINRGPRSKYLFIKFNNKEVESFDFVIIDFNTTDQETIDTVRTAKRVVNNKLYDKNDGLIGTIDTSKIEVGGIYDENAWKANGLFCNMTMNGYERGLVLSEFNSDLSSLNDGDSMFTNCTDLTSFTSNLSSLTKGKYMFYECTNITTFSTDLPSLTSGVYMFTRCTNLTSFISDMSSLTDGSFMFRECANLTSFISDMSGLTNGYYMFYDCPKLMTFSSDLSSLTNSNHMFEGCANLTTFNSNLSSLTDGQSMFSGCSQLTSFDSDLSSLTNSGGMFGGCSQLTSFDSDLSSLTNSGNMFYNCSQLTSFTSDLSSLMTGIGMFQGCKLDASSVKNIIDTINTITSSGNSNNLSLGMGCDDTTEDKDIFAQEVGYENMTTLLAALQAKGWRVDVQYNGRPATT